MSKSEHNGKITVAMVSRGFMTKRDAVELYYLHQNPQIENVIVLPFYFRGKRQCQRNIDFALKGEKLLGQDAKNRYLIGYDLNEVFAALPEGEKPASESVDDIVRFVDKAFHAHEKRKITSEEKEINKHVRLSAVDRGNMRLDRARFFSIDQINACDVMHFDMHSQHVGHYAKTFDAPFFLNSRANTHIYDSKETLPILADAVNPKHSESARIIAKSANVKTPDDIVRFMDENTLEKIVIKPYRGNQGAGIYAVTKDDKGQLIATRNGKKGPRIKSMLAHGPHLVMEWLEPSKGDVRLVGMNGKIIGAYNRVPAEGNDIANIHGGGDVVPHDYILSAEERKNAERVLKELKDKGLNSVGVDLLADKDGRRYVSEVNIGFHGGLEKIHDFELARKPQGMTVGARYAQGMVDAYRSRNKAPDLPSF